MYCQYLSGQRCVQKTCSMGQCSRTEACLKTEGGLHHPIILMPYPVTISFSLNHITYPICPPIIGTAPSRAGGTAVRSKRVRLAHLSVKNCHLEGLPRSCHLYCASAISVSSVLMYPVSTF